MEPIIGGGVPGQNGGPDGAVIKDSNTENFMADVIEASRETPVVVDFWAPWCEPCKQLGPAIEKVVRAAGGAVRLVKINIDENQ
ncbi:MAG: co-chaperone YbbN, partial [Rhodospirillaceae bacterium]|nr:co-chaperone YbbN [Rhodospirillaceae bacterium]